MKKLSFSLVIEKVEYDSKGKIEIMYISTSINGISGEGLKKSSKSDLIEIINNKSDQVSIEVLNSKGEEVSISDIESNSI